MAQKTYRFKVTVRGSGPFPIDMLRYDHCWPRSEGDSYKIAADYNDEKNPPRKRDVELLTDHDRRAWETNVDRWRSFGWDVVSQEQIQ